MAGIDDTVADDGQPIATTADSIAGPGASQMAVDAVADEGDKTNIDEGTKVCPNNPQHLVFLHLDDLAFNTVPLQDHNVSQRTFRDPPAAQKSPLL